ncbi:hypothetical protein VTN49DRAFT_3242 [Thermomyces lanuginosus]|uniref:uncharacterized protein n=1 Tax=Thermomyces lanuginosus TaxID=5541 RepID=UPI00374442E8
MRMVQAPTGWRFESGLSVIENGLFLLLRNYHILDTRFCHGQYSSYWMPAKDRISHLAHMFNTLRPATRRLLNARWVSYPARSRSISTTSLSSVRSSNTSCRIALQRRWNTSGNGVSKESTTAPSSAAAKQEDAAVKTEAMDNKAQTENAPSTQASAGPAESSAAAPTGSTAGQAESVTTSTAGSAAPQDTRPELRSPSPKETIYVGNLFFDVTAADLTNHFKKFGNVTYATIVHDSRGLSKGFGYITFDSVEAATRAVEAMNTQIFEGRRIIVQFAQANTTLRRAHKPPTRTLYVGNLPFDMSDRELNELFRSVHNVIDVRVAVERKTGQFLGFVHADFLDVPSAQAAYEFLSSRTPHGRRLRLDYAPTRYRRSPGNLSETGFDSSSSSSSDTATKDQENTTENGENKAQS